MRLEALLTKSEVLETHESTQKGRSFHYHRVFCGKSDGKVYRVTLNIFERIWAAVVKLFGGDYFKSRNITIINTIEDVNSEKVESIAKTISLPHLSPEPQNPTLNSSKGTNGSIPSQLPTNPTNPVAENLQEERQLSIEEKIERLVEVTGKKPEQVIKEPKQVIREILCDEKLREDYELIQIGFDLLDQKQKLEHESGWYAAILCYCKEENLKKALVDFSGSNETLIFEFIPEVYGAKEIWAVLEQDLCCWRYDNITPLNKAMKCDRLWSTTRYTDSMVAMIKKLGSIPDNHKDFSYKSNSVLRSALKTDRPDFMKELFSENIFKKLITKKDSQGNSVLHETFRKNFSNVAQKLLEIATPEELKIAMQPNVYGQTPLHLFSGEKSMRRVFQALMEVVAVCRGELLRDVLLPDHKGHRFIETVLGSGFIDAIPFVEYLVNISGQTLAEYLDPVAGLYYLTALACKPTINPFAGMIPPKQVIQAMMPFFDLREMKFENMCKVEIAKSLKLLPDIWSKALLCGVCLNIQERKKLLKDLFEDRKDRIKFVCMNKALHPINVQNRSVEQMAEEAGVTEAEIKSALNLFIKRFGSIEHNGWNSRHDYILALAGAGNDPDGIIPFIPLLQHYHKHSDRRTNMSERHLLARYPLATESRTSFIADIIPKKLGMNHPSLYLLALNGLEQRGVSKEILLSIHESIQKNKKTFREEGYMHKLLFETLTTLALTTELNDQECIHLLKYISEGDLVGKLSDIHIILFMGKFTLLKSNYLKGHPDIKQIAFNCFKAYVPLKNQESFAEGYSRCFAKKRDASALMTYVSKVCRIKRTMKDLAKWIESVYSGTVLEQRYSDENNPHLKKLYEISPHLRKVLPSLAKDIKCKTVDELNSGSVGERESWMKNIIKQKIVDDKHLSHERFSRLVKFLTSENIDERIELRKSISKERTQKSKLKDKGRDPEYLELCLHQQLMTLQNLVEKEKPNRVAIKKAISGAIEISKKLEVLGCPIGELSNDLDGALVLFKNSANKDFGSYKVSLTDDYWDMFMIGTEVQGSCQRVNGNPKLNKCLLGYVMDGKTFAIVARKPGNEAVSARRLLRFEVDNKAKKPALFLERLYSNHDSTEIDDAIIAMAKSIAERLSLPLYTKGRYQSQVELYSLGSAASYVYSDAAAENNHINFGKYWINSLESLFIPN